MCSVFVTFIALVVMMAFDVFEIGSTFILIRFIVADIDICFIGRVRISSMVVTVSGVVVSAMCPLVCIIMVRSRVIVVVMVFVVYKDSETPASFMDVCRTEEIFCS